MQPFYVRNHGRKKLFECGTGAGEINHGPSIWFSGSCWVWLGQENIFSQVQMSFIGKRSSIKWSGPDSSLPSMRGVTLGPHHLCCIIAVILHVTLTIWKGSLKPNTCYPEKFLSSCITPHFRAQPQGIPCVVILTAHLWQLAPFSSPIMIRNKAGYIWNEDLFSGSN